MKKIIFFLLTFTCITFTQLHAQINKIDGPLEKAPPAPDIVAVIGMHNNSVYILRKNEDKLTAEAYNKNSLAKEWSTEIKMQKGEDMLSYNSGYLCGLNGKQIYVLVPAVKHKSLVLISKTINTDGKLNPESKDLVIIEGVRKPDLYKWQEYYKYTSLFRYYFSPDSSKAIFWLCDPNTMGGYVIENNSMRGAIIDTKNLTIISNQLPKKYNDKYIAARNYAINNDGKIVCAFTYAKDQNTNGFLMAVYENNTEKIISPNFATADKVVLEDCEVLFGGNNKIFFSAILTDAEKKDGKKKNTSVYAMRYDVKSSKIDFEETKYLSDAWREKYDPAKVASTGFSGHSSYKYYFNFSGDGTWVISALKKGGWNRGVKYHSTDDAIITKVSPIGKIEWTRIIPVSVAVRSGFNKAGLLDYWNCSLYNGKMYYIFDSDVKDEKNIDLDKVDESKETETVTEFSGKNINTSCVIIDMTGKMQRITICNNKDKGFSPFTGPVLLDKNKMLLHFISNGGEQNFSILNLQ